MLCKPRGKPGDITSGTLAADAVMSDGFLESVGTSRKSFLIRDLLNSPADDPLDRGAGRLSPDVSQGKMDRYEHPNLDERLWTMRQKSPSSF